MKLRRSRSVVLDAGLHGFERGTSRPRDLEDFEAWFGSTVSRARILGSRSRRHSHVERAAFQDHLLLFGLICEQSPYATSGRRSRTP